MTKRKELSAFIPYQQMLDQHNHNMNFLFYQLMSDLGPMSSFDRDIEEAIEGVMEALLWIKNYGIAFENMMESLQDLAEHVDPRQIRDAGEALNKAH